MKLAINTLFEGVNPFHFDSRTDAWIAPILTGLESHGYKVTSPLVIDLQLTKLDPDFYLKGKLDFGVDQVCSRCAENFSLEIKHPFEIALAKVPSIKLRSPELSEESDELDINFFEGNEIELTPIITEQFFLSIPYQSLCQRDCQGICRWLAAIHNDLVMRTRGTATPPRSSITFSRGS